MGELRKFFNHVPDRATQRSLEELESYFYTLGRGKSALDAGLSAGIWADCPRLQIAMDPGVGNFAMDDFISLATDGFPYDIIGANGTFLPVVAQSGGVAQALATGTDNDECYVTWNNNLAGFIMPNATRNWWFEARVKLSQITVEQGVFVGLIGETESAVDLMTDATMALKVVDSIGFQIVHATAAAAVWQSIHQKAAGARVAVNSSLALGSTNWVKLGMRSILGTVTFFVDGVANGSTVLSSATNFPTTTECMNPCFAVKTGAGSANSLYVDWWAAGQVR